MKTIYIAGGCFWGVEEYYHRLKGVEATRVGYAQGTMDHPTYKDVCTKETGHTETVEVIYDPEIISLEMILDHLFRFIDPTVLNRQGNDIGTQYRTGIYYVDEDDAPVIDAFIASRQSIYAKPIVVEHEKLNVFWEAEPYHQMYLEINPQGYCHVDFNVIKPHELKSQ